MARERTRFAFAITEGPNAGLSSSGWRVWTNKEDIYVTSTGFGKKLKVSLHGDHAWRMAPTAEFVRAGGDFQIKDRETLDLDFKVVPMGPDGIRMTFVIMVPRSALTWGGPGKGEIPVTVNDRWDQFTKATVWTTEPGVGRPVDETQLVGGPSTLTSGREVWVSWGTESCVPSDPEPVPAGSMIEPRYPPTHAVACPGFMVRGVNIG